MSEHLNCGHAYRWMSQTRMGTRRCTWHATMVRMWWWMSWSSVARMWTRLMRRASHPCTSPPPHGTERSALSCSWEMELMSISRWDLYYGCTCDKNHQWIPLKLSYLSFCRVRMVRLLYIWPLSTGGSQDLRRLFKMVSLEFWNFPLLMCKPAVSDSVLFVSCMCRCWDRLWR